MFGLGRLISSVAIGGLLVVVGVLHTAAQESTPSVGASVTMSAAETQAVIDAYLAALVAREDIAPFFSDDVVLELGRVCKFDFRTRVGADWVRKAVSIPVRIPS